MTNGTTSNREESEGIELINQPQINIISEHYNRPEVREIILSFAEPEEGFRGLNGNSGWYVTQQNGDVRLRTADDYDNTVKRFRTLYATLDVFDPSVKTISRKWDKDLGRPVEPLGTFADCRAYTLGTDIDGIGDIESPEVKLAVENAGQFLVNYLAEQGIVNSVYCLFSGGGIYVLLHHNLTQAFWSPEECELEYSSLTRAFNFVLAEVEEKFFEKYPQHKGKVKFDKLNNQKRKFKCIFSIHKKLDYCVIPLNPWRIEINFEKSKLPLSEEVLKEAAQWYQTFELSELTRLRELLRKHQKLIKESLTEQKSISGEVVSIFSMDKPLPLDKFPPCMQNIISGVNSDRGPHRALAVLASYLYSAGWSEEDAFALWRSIAAKSGVEPRIFYCWYGQMICPRCTTLQQKSSGYPQIGLGDLGYCMPNDNCDGWPGSYTSFTPLLLENALLALEDDHAFERDNDLFSQKMANRVKSGQHLTNEEYSHVYRMVRNYREQLLELGTDIREIPSELPKNEAAKRDKTKSIGTHLAELALKSGAKLWYDREKDPYITINKDGHHEHHPLKSKFVRLWLSALSFKIDGRAPGSQVTQDALDVLAGLALSEGQEYNVFVRVAQHEDEIYVDLGNDSWECIEIDTEGWRIISDPPVRFRRPKTQGPLPTPFRGGEWEYLRKLINCPENDAPSDRNWILIVAWLIQAFWPKGPYAHLNFTGEQGTGKSMIQKMLKLLVDPSTTILRRPPRDERDLMIAAKNERIPSFDNLSGMPKHLSDAFCGLATGTALASRQLYTDNEEAILVARRPCLMNGIDSLTDRGDLQDRTIEIELPKIDRKNRKQEKIIMAEFEDIRPFILGLILDATSEGLRQEDKVSQNELLRMADFCQWVAACESKLPWKPGEFMTAYFGQAEDALKTLVESSSVAMAIYEMVLVLANATEEKDRCFNGSATELLERLNIQQKIYPEHVPKGWPKTASQLGSILKRFAPALREKGVQVDWDRSSGERKITLSLVGKGDDERKTGETALEDSKRKTGLWEVKVDPGQRTFGEIDQETASFSENDSTSAINDSRMTAENLGCRHREIDMHRMRVVGNDGDDGTSTSVFSLQGRGDGKSSDSSVEQLKKKEKAEIRYSEENGGGKMLSLPSTDPSIEAQRAENKDDSTPKNDLSLRCHQAVRNMADTPGQLTLLNVPDPKHDEVAEDRTNVAGALGTDLIQTAILNTLDSEIEFPCEKEVVWKKNPLDYKFLREVRVRTRKPRLVDDKYRIFVGYTVTYSRKENMKIRQEMIKRKLNTDRLLDCARRFWYVNRSDLPGHPMFLPGHRPGIDYYPIEAVDPASIKVGRKSEKLTC